MHRGDIIGTIFLIEFRWWCNIVIASRRFRNWIVRVDRDRSAIEPSRTKCHRPVKRVLSCKRISIVDRTLFYNGNRENLWWNDVFESLLQLAGHNSYDLQCMDWDDTPRRRLAAMSTVIVGWVTTISSPRWHVSRPLGHPSNFNLRQWIGNEETQGKSLL